jgi:hypothetical protein
MIEPYSNEFWIAVLFVTVFFLVIFLFFLVKRLNRQQAELSLIDVNASLLPEQDIDDSDAASTSGKEIIKMLEPLLRESRKTAIQFDKQIREKRQLLKELNDSLDSRIISINLLLSRADAMQQKLEKKQMMAQGLPASNPLQIGPNSSNVLTQQSQILELYSENKALDDIASQLSIPKGEVQLVIDLKKKFMEMESHDK